MNDLIETFFQSKYTEETQENLYSAIGLLTLFGYVEPMGDIVDTIMRSGFEDETYMTDKVRMTIEHAIDRLLHENRVAVHIDVTFRERIQLLEGIYAISRLEDTKDFLPLFDGWLSNEEIFAHILSRILSEPYEDIFVRLASVYDGTIDRLKEFLEEVKVENETVEFGMLKMIRKNLRVYAKVFGTPTIIENIQEVDIIKGQKFSVYLDLLRDEIVDTEDMESTVYALLWFALISEDGHMDPKSLLMEQAKVLFLEPVHLNLFNSMLTKALGEFLPTREVEK